MHDFYINNVKIDWSQISKYSYLQSIKAITYEYENLRSFKGGDKTPNYHEMSHGESFIKYIEGFDSTGLFILDE